MEKIKIIAFILLLLFFIGGCTTIILLAPRYSPRNDIDIRQREKDTIKKEPINKKP